jgi:prevent-host-death family protein
MNVPISEAKAHLTDLVRRAEAGDEIVLTRHGHAVVRLTPVQARPTNVRESKALLERLGASGMRRVKEGADAARSRDFLYDDGSPK